MERKKILIIILIIGIACLILGPVLGFLMNKITVSDNSVIPVSISEASSSGIQDAHSIPITLDKGQKAIIQFAVYYENITTTLKIFGLGVYNRQYALNSAPTGLTGRNFLYSIFAYGQSPSSSTFSTNSRSITEDGFYYMEFAGDTNGDYLISVPGQYVIVVYGTNSSPTDTDVLFNIKVEVDGPGTFLSSLFITIGILLLVLWVGLLAYAYIKLLRRGI